MHFVKLDFKEDREMKIKFQPITEPNLYGYVATLGNKKAEIIRAYGGEWLLFTYFDLTMQRKVEENQKRMSYGQAKVAAITFLRFAKEEK